MSEPASINGIPVEPIPGESILLAGERIGAEIPTLCHADHLEPEGGCRMCLVHVAGRERPAAACHTVLLPGMDIRTHTPEIEAVRRTLLSFYSDTGEETGFHGEAVAHGSFLDLEELYETNRPSANPGAAPWDDSHPYLRFQPDACITCRLCLNACEQVQGQFVYGIENRGPQTRLVFGAGPRFADSPCVACGACVDVCPTGAVTDRDRIGGNGNSIHTLSVCGHCGVGCRVDIATQNGRVTRIRGVEDAAVNRGHLCVKGRYAHPYQHSPDRLTRPRLRDGNGNLREVEWDEALDFIARRLTEIRAESGPDALGAFTSSRSTNEACYLLQKLFRAVVGTNNVDCCARDCHSSTALALQLVTGTGAASASYADFETARCIVLAGANPTEAHPVAGARLKQAVLRGAPLLVIDPRRIELAEYADFHLQLRPGTNVALFNGLAKILFEEHLVDLDYLEERTEGIVDLHTFLKTVSLGEVSSITGVEEADLCGAARLLGTHAPALFVHGLGLSELMQGTASVMTLCNLGMLTGSIGKPGAGMLPLRGQNNVQGSADMGGMPTHVTGYQPVGEPEVRERLRKIWGAVPPEQPGLPSTLMLRAAAEGKVRGLWLMGDDVVQSDPNETGILKAMERLDLIIVQDLFFSETARHAHVLLPSAGCLEQEGTFTNGERRIQHVLPAVNAPGDARTDWVPVQQVAERMGASWHYSGAAAIMEEIAGVAPQLFGGVRYDRLGSDGLQWPCPSRDHPGTVTVHGERFLRGKGKLVTIDHEPGPEHGVEGYPYLLVTGRLLDHYNVGTMTRRTPQATLVGRDQLEIHPEDAERDHIPDGTCVTLTSRWGAIEVPVRHSSRVAPGTLFLTFHFPETHTNRLTGPTLDPQSKCPQYKATAVRLKPA